MGICRFFQQGSCRFGTKCSNEHFDVKVVLKNDMEASINGKMWPFSVYGPFKDKGNIPNFIEDQSFEEVRLLCYEAKRLNSFDQFHQQFNREVMEATNKMKSMVQATPQVVDVMIKIFDAPEGGTSAVAGAPNQNPFATTAGNGPAGSIFSKPTLGGGNILGAANQVNNTQSLFGGSMAAGNTGNSIFGGGNVAGGGSVFGQQQPQQQQQQQQGVAAQSFQGGNIFSQAQAQPQAANQMPFGGFQQQPQQQQQQQQPGAGGGVFGQAAVNPSGGIFGQVAQQPQQPPSGLFAQAAQTVGFQQQQPQQMMQQQQAQQQQMMQQANPQQQQQLLQQQQQQMMQQQQQQQQMMQQQQQQQQQQSQQPQPPGGSSIYSTMESLTPAEIEAFKAEQFLPGHVPFNPPPRELC
ncbi:ras-interacting protein RIP3-like [Drosophila madeirensis]|uniref:Nucleoporin NUP42 n=1 Tax=Drosophila madeirensis TaxID=30013 RepID=A0AAU9FJL4_DROMD